MTENRNVAETVPARPHARPSSSDVRSSPVDARSHLAVRASPEGGPGRRRTHGALRVSCLSRLTMLALDLPVRPRNWYLLVWLGPGSVVRSVPRFRGLER